MLIRGGCAERNPETRSFRATQDQKQQYKVSLSFSELDQVPRGLPPSVPTHGLQARDTLGLTSRLPLLSGVLRGLLPPEGEERNVAQGS